MSAPVRLIDGGGDPLEGELLRAALRESATDEGRARVARALGVPQAAASGLGSSAVDAGAGRLARAAAPAGSSSGHLAGVRLGTFAKYSLFGVFGGLVMLAGSAAWQARPARDGTAADLALSAPEPALPLVPLPDEHPSKLAPQPSARPEDVAGRVAPLEPRQRAIRRVARAVAPAEDPLLAEVRQLDRARLALRTADRARALQLLDEYAAAFPHGGLAHEAAQLRARAEQARGVEIRGSRDAQRDIGEAR